MKKTLGSILRGFSFAAGLLLISGCATYNYAERVKMISFTDDLKKGQSIGNIRGEDCTWQILGYQLGGAPSLDRAFNHTQHQTDGSSLAGSLKGSSTHNGGSLRYAVNVSTRTDGFNAGLFGKQCIVVTGAGYR